MIFFDATETIQTGINSGIQRVVRELQPGIDTESIEARAVYLHSETPGSFPFWVNGVPAHNNATIPTIISKAKPLLRIFMDSYVAAFLMRFRPLLALISMILRMLSAKRIAFQSDELSSIGSSDTLILADSFWARGGAVVRHLETGIIKPMKVVWLVHDIIPYSHPHLGHALNNALFKFWVPRLLPLCTGLVFTTHWGASEFQRLFGPLQIPYKVINLGAAKSGTPDKAGARTETRTRPREGILVVGTIEPRKDLKTVLDWREAQGQETESLTIVGQVGWKSRKVIQRILRLEALGQIRWLRETSDEELFELMSTNRLGISASIVEGFGLPVQEMLNHGMSVVVSDIPVYRELFGNCATFFRVGDVTSLSNALAQSTQASDIKCERTWAEARKSFWSSLAQI